MAGQASFGHRKINDQPNIIPMLDVLLCLVAFVLVLASAEHKGIPVNLPKASSSVPINDTKAKNITIARDGQIYYEAFPVSLEELSLKLAEQKAATPDMQVSVKGDGEVAFQKVVDVLNLMRRLDIQKFGVITGDRKPGAAE